MSVCAIYSRFLFWLLMLVVMPYILLFRLVGGWKGVLIVCVLAAFTILLIVAQ